MTSSGYQVKQRRGRTICIIVLAWCLPRLTSSCSSKCWNVISEPTGKKCAHSGNKFTIPITSGKAMTGVITVNGTFFPREFAFNPTPRDTIDFTVRDPETQNWFVQPLKITMGFSATEGRSYAELACARKSSGSQPIEEGKTGVQFNDHVKEVDTMFSGNEINIQVSDLEVLTKNWYLLYLGKPGSSRKFEYNYDSPVLWESDTYSSNRLDATNEVSNSDRDGLYVYNSITVCTDPQPVLCDDESKGPIKAQLNQNVTLSCSASGAPYLGSRWERTSTSTIVEDHQEKIEVADNGADNVIESTLQIPAFTTDHIGVYTCIIFNKNFGNSVEKHFTLRYSHEISLLQVPCSDTFTTEDESPKFIWTVEGWPLNNITLACDHPDSDLKINYTNILLEYSPPRRRVELQFDVKVVPDVINCDIRDGTKVLDHRTISRVGYNCTDEQFPVGKECYTKYSSKQAIPVWLSHTLAFVGGMILGILAALYFKSCLSNSSFMNNVSKIRKKYGPCYQAVSTSPESRVNDAVIDLDDKDAAKADNSASLPENMQKQGKSATEKDSGVRQRKGKEKSDSEKKFDGLPSRKGNERKEDIEENNKRAFESKFGSAPSDMEYDQTKNL